MKTQARTIRAKITNLLRWPKTRVQFQPLLTWQARSPRLMGWITFAKFQKKTVRLALTELVQMLQMPYVFQTGLKIVAFQGFLQENLIQITLKKLIFPIEVPKEANVNQEALTDILGKSDKTSFQTFISSNHLPRRSLAFWKHMNLRTAASDSQKLNFSPEFSMSPKDFLAWENKPSYIL